MLFNAPSSEILNELSAEFLKALKAISRDESRKSGIKDFDILFNVLANIRPNFWY